MGAGLPVPGEGCSSAARSRRHCEWSVTAPPLRTPGRCPPLPPSIFWVCLLVSSLELWWLSASWQRRPYSCFPLVGPEVSWELALHWAPSDSRPALSQDSPEAACAACPGLASQSRPSPAWRPGPGWTSSRTRSFFSMCGAAQREFGCARAPQAAGVARSGLPGAAGLGAGHRPGLYRRRRRSQMRI